MKKKMKLVRGIPIVVGLGFILTYSNVIAEPQWIPNASPGKDTVGSYTTGYWDWMNERYISYTAYITADCCVKSTDMNACNRGAYDANCPYQKPAGDVPVGQ